MNCWERKTRSSVSCARSATTGKAPREIKALIVQDKARACLHSWLVAHLYLYTIPVQGSGTAPVAKFTCHACVSCTSPTSIFNIRKQVKLKAQEIRTQSPH